MQKCFQNIFVNPSDYSEVSYIGTFDKNGAWENGLLKSKECEYEVKNGASFFGSEHEGDQFRDEDIELWTAGGHFKRVWENRGSHNDFFNDIHHALTDEAAKLNLPVMEIACGPNMGLLPHIIAKNNSVQCLATDACPQVITNWQKFLAENSIDTNISFASFNAANMPIRSNSVDIITSNIALSSLRYAGDDCVMGLNEIFRVLKPGGYIFALENEYEDMSLLNKVFELWGKENWYKNNKLKWTERFEKAGFEIVYEKSHSKWKLRADDMDLGEAAAKHGIDINILYSVYKLKKK